jgi:hypothetical protein
MVKKWLTSRSCNNEADRIWDDWYDTMHFSASQVISVQTCKILHWCCSSWTLNIVFIRQELVTRKHCFRSPVFIKHFFSCIVCSFTLCRFRRSYFIHPVRAPELLIPSPSPFEADIADAELNGYWSNPSKIFPCRDETLFSLVLRLTFEKVFPR